MTAINEFEKKLADINLRKSLKLRIVIAALVIVGCVFATQLFLARLYPRNYEDIKAAVTKEGFKSEFVFAVVGDFGLENDNTKKVSQMVKSWNPDLIITTGDNNYPEGEADTIDKHIGQYYADYIYPYSGKYKKTSQAEQIKENRFFPSLGNHDVETDDGKPYLDYFELPGNERYYDFEKGSVHFFVINSNEEEPDGNKKDSKQAMWLKEKMSSSTKPFQIVYFHHPPYSSGELKKFEKDMRWPFKDWGADAVFSGHEHFYERMEVNGIPYFIIGLSGTHKIYPIGKKISESKKRYNKIHGAVIVRGSDEKLEFKFITKDGEIIDTHTITRK